MWPRTPLLALRGGSSAPPPPPPPPPPPGLAITISPGSSQSFRYNGAGGTNHQILTSDTYGCGPTSDGGVPVTNPQFTWSCPGCTVNGQGTSTASFNRDTFDNENVTLSISCVMEDLDIPGRSAGASASVNFFSAAG